MKSKHAPKRSKYQMEQDRAEVARLALDGYGQRAIVEWVARHRRYTLSLGMVNRIVQEVIAQWRQDASRDIDAVKARDLARILDTERKATEAYERSCKPRVVKRRHKDGKVYTSTETRAGDPRWLETILKCIERRSKILGYDAPQKLELDSMGTQTPEIGPDVAFALEFAYGHKRALSESNGGSGVKLRVPASGNTNPVQP